MYGVSLQANKSELSPSVRYHNHLKIVFPCTSPDHRPQIEEKVSVIIFIQILPKNFVCGIYFQLHILDLFEKPDGTKSLNTKQYPAGLSTKITPQASPFLLKMSPPLMLLYCTYHVSTVTLPINL